MHHLMKSGSDFKTHNKLSTVVRVVLSSHYDKREKEKEICFAVRRLPSSLSAQFTRWPTKRREDAEMAVAVEVAVAAAARRSGSGAFSSYIRLCSFSLTRHSFCFPPRFVPLPSPPPCPSP